MESLWEQLASGSYVLDLGSGRGSFLDGSSQAVLISCDRDRSAPAPEPFVQCDAAALPFPDQLFHAVISNHSMEHFNDLGRALEEIGRVIRRDGFLYVAVPDASTICDRLYRWLARGGGHR